MEIVRTVKPFFVDKRGSLTHLLPHETVITSVLLITCKKNAIRANHYHKKDHHFVYMVSGSMDYSYRSRTSKNVKTIRVLAGQIVYTPAGTLHRMKFVTNASFLALTTEKRSQKQYEHDTIRVKNL